MLSVEPRGLDGGDEELGAVGAWSSVGHGEEAGGGVLADEVLIGELLSVDGLTSGSVAAGEVSTLAHEGLDHTVERASLVVEGLASAADSLLSGAESAEVLSGSGDSVGKELFLWVFQEARTTTKHKEQSVIIIVIVFFVVVSFLEGQREKKKEKKRMGREGRRGDGPRRRCVQRDDLQW